ncbi:MAG: lipoyl(octanoyl) transferase LipB [Cocleimonas sp.]|nr:lipoyl(octanoyl) transferase LipB [Cocleimonas sp.]
MGIVISQAIKIKQLGQQDYHPVWQAMQDFTQQRTKSTADEIWVVEHPAVFTLGRNGKKEHILNAGSIPVISIDRGGQVTYHGLGQLIVYPLIDLKRRHLGVRKFVTLIETAIIDVLASYDVVATSNPKAPGVYVMGKKIAALGLRISRGCSTHGLSLNINMDLQVFKRINPCGYKGLDVTQCKDLGIEDAMADIANSLVQGLMMKIQANDDSL